MNLGENIYISIGLGVGFHVVRYRKKLLFIAIHEKENHYNDESLGAAITLFGNDMVFVDELRNDLYKARSYSSKKANETASFVMCDNITSPFVLKDFTMVISALQNDFLTSHIFPRLINTWEYKII